jgi:hypothetical protein
MRTDMTYAIGNNGFVCRRAALVLALFAAVAIGGCQSPMYSGTPDDTYSYSVAPASDPSYVGRNAPADEAGQQQAWTAEQKYEYRGGRDPVSGRAHTQM